MISHATIFPPNCPPELIPDMEGTRKRMRKLMADFPPLTPATVDEMMQTGLALMEEERLHGRCKYPLLADELDPHEFPEAFEPVSRDPLFVVDSIMGSGHYLDFDALEE